MGGGEYVKKFWFENWEVENLKLYERKRENDKEGEFGEMD